MGASMQSEISLIRSIGLRSSAALIVACAGVLTTAAFAADTDKRRDTLFNPTPEPALRDFARDCDGLGNGAALGGKARVIIAGR